MEAVGTWRLGGELRLPPVHNERALIMIDRARQMLGRTERSRKHFRDKHGHRRAHMMHREAGNASPWRREAFSACHATTMCCHTLSDSFRL